MTFVRKLMAWWRNTRDMPLLLRVFCVGGMLVPLLFLPIFIVPNISTYELNGRPISFAQFWSSGMAPEIFAALLLVCAGCWGLAARDRESRWFLVLAPVIPTLIAVPFALINHSTDDLGGISSFVEAIVTSAVIYVCLFKIPSIQAYL